ncbi:MAG TPA: hypothetical protein VI215_02390 [Bacteroidota bacterium]|jgi:Tfp pilus assembly PilM family ATPase
MMFGTYVAGISVADDRAHLAVLQVKKGDVRLKYLGEFARAGERELWFLEELLAGKEKALRKVSRVSVALDHAEAVQHCFPSDSSLSGSDEQDQIVWELSNLIPAFDPEAYTREKHLLQTHAHRQFSDVLVVAYRKSLLKHAEASLRSKNIGLEDVGTNHFGAQHALFLANPEVKSKMVALVHVMRNRVDVGLINRGKLIHYRTARAESAPAVLDVLADRLSSFSVSDIFLHGPAVSPGLTEEAGKRFASAVTNLNPFREMKVASSFGEFDSYRGKEHRFASAVGSALRSH